MRQGDHSNTDEREEPIGNDSSQMEISLGEALTIEHVGRLYEEMKGRIEGKDDEMRLDCSKLDQVDGAGVQLVAAFVLEAKNRGVAVRWTGDTVLLREGMALLGLQHVCCGDSLDRVRPT